MRGADRPTASEVRIGTVVLPVRRDPARAAATAVPDTLQFDPSDAEEGVPACHGRLGSPSAVDVRIRIRVFSRAGICLLSGEGRIAAGSVDFAVRGIRPLGVEAYAHRSADQRTEMGRRVFARGTHTTIELEAGG